MSMLRLPLGHYTPSHSPLTVKEGSDTHQFCGRHARAIASIAVLYASLCQLSLGYL